MDLQLLLLFYLHYNQFHAARTCFDIKHLQHSFSKCKGNTTSDSYLKYHWNINNQNFWYCKIARTTTLDSLPYHVGAWTKGQYFANEYLMQLKQWSILIKIMEM